MAKKKNNKKNAQQMISKKLITKHCNKAIYNEVEKYIKRILVEKNHYAEALKDDIYMKLRIIHGLDENKFYTEYNSKVKLIDKRCPTTDLQIALRDIHTKFDNQTKQVDFNVVLTYPNKRYYELKKEGKLDKYPYIKPYKNICKETKLENLLSYMCDRFLFTIDGLRDKMDELDKGLTEKKKKKIEEDKKKAIAEGREYIPEKVITGQFNKNQHEVIRELIKFYLNDDSERSIKNYIFSRKTKTYLEWQELINKYSYGRLLALAFRKFFNRIRSLKINFKKLTIGHRNTLNSLDKHYEKVKPGKYNNLIFNLKFPKQKLIKIPFKTNYCYHHKMDNLNINFIGKAKSTPEYDKYKVVNGHLQSTLMITIKLDEVKKEVQIIYAVLKNDKNSKPTTTFNEDFEIEKKKTIGIDVNTKNNIFALSDGKTFTYDEWIVDECIKFDKERAEFQRKNGNIKFTKRMRIKQDRLNDQSKAFLDKKVGELIKYCREKKYNHIVMENLNLKGTKSNVKGEKGLNYNRLASLLHLNDVKNVIKRIASHYGIMVSFINPKYTSKQCLVCGCIDPKNRPIQELFSCINGDHSASNADINAACNIRNRITIFKNQLNIKFDEKFNGFKESKYTSKQNYIDLYEDFDVFLVMDELWTIFEL